MCCIGQKGSELSTKLKLGMVCDDDIVNFEVLNLFWSTLECFNPEEPQCLEQKDIDRIWDNVSQLCGVCFAPYGSVYVISNDEVLITEAGDPIITEDGQNLTDNETCPHYV
jgi:hypothetical protein